MIPRSAFINLFVYKQYSGQEHKDLWAERCYNEEKYWGGFSREPFNADTYHLPDWAIGPFSKHPGNPVFAPSQNSWDAGHIGGGVHNGSILRKDGKFYYIYRGEQDYTPTGFNEFENMPFNYICDIGVAVSDDGIHFERCTKVSPFFRKDVDEIYSFEDVNVVKKDDTYYLFCNRRDWENLSDPSKSGVYLATSKDLLHWDKVGLIFPDADCIHRNPCVVQNPENEAGKSTENILCTSI